MNALGQLIEQAESGDPDAQFVLGALYDEGYGLPQCYDDSMRWFRRAGAQGHAAAQCSIGVNYAAGHGVGRNYARALAWFREAAKQNYAKAQFNLGLMSLRALGTPRNYAEAAIWLRKAADRGHARAQALLGGLHIKGTGAPKDYAEAAVWLQKAADQGNAEAKIILKLLHADNEGATASSHDEPAIAQLDSAMDNRWWDELSSEADQDELTGVLNRHAFLRVVQARIDCFHPDSVGGPSRGLSVFVVKLDPLEYGSKDAGYRIRDSVLCGLADRLSENLRQSDVVGRIDVDRFAVCLAAITLHDAKVLAKRLCRAVAARPFETPTGPLSLTVRIGVEAISVGDTLPSLLRRANAATLVGPSTMKIQLRDD